MNKLKLKTALAQQSAENFLKKQMPYLYNEGA